MAELVRLGRTTVDISKMIAFHEEDGELVTLIFDGTASLAIEGTEAARFLRYVGPRVVDAVSHSPTMSIEAGDPGERSPEIRTKRP